MTYIQPVYPIYEGGLTELVGTDEEVNTDDYSGSVGILVSKGPITHPISGETIVHPISGEILSFMLYGTEDGSGAVPVPAGKLILLNADPDVSPGDTALAAAEWPTVIGVVSVAATDWIFDANGGAAFIPDQPVPFHNLTDLYFVWFHEDAADLNDAGADDEQLEFNFWFRVD